jgi:hypothetical protein
VKLLEFLDKWLQPTKSISGGEDLADSIALIVIMGLLLMVVFL